MGGSFQKIRSAERSVAEHTEQLRRHLRSRLNCEEDAKDIAQEACLKMVIAQRAGKIQNPRAYLFQIARNLLYHHYATNRLSLEAGIDVDVIQSTAPSPEDQFVQTTRQQAIEQAMRELPVKCQTAIVLRWRDGLRIAEIAERMALSRAMVKKYLANGNVHFRKRLRRFAVADLVAVG